jgi:hypothetical protein
MAGRPGGRSRGRAGARPCRAGHVGSGQTAGPRGYRPDRPAAVPVVRDGRLDGPRRAHCAPRRHGPGPGPRRRAVLRAAARPRPYSGRAEPFVADVAGRVRRRSPARDAAAGRPRPAVRDGRRERCRRAGHDRRHQRRCQRSRAQGRGTAPGPAARRRGGSQARAPDAARPPAGARRAVPLLGRAAGRPLGRVCRGRAPAATTAGRPWRRRAEEPHGKARRRPAGPAGRGASLTTSPGRPGPRPRRRPGLRLGMLRGLSAASGLAVVGSRGARAGELVTCLPFPWSTREEAEAWT